MDQLDPTRCPGTSRCGAACEWRDRGGRAHPSRWPPRRRRASGDLRDGYDSDYLSVFEHRPPKNTTAIAGNIENAQADAYTLGFRARVAKEAFEERNDLVVATDLAAGGSDDAGALVITSDHFSYYREDQKKVFDAIDTAVIKTLHPGGHGLRRASAEHLCSPAAIRKTEYPPRTAPRPPRRRRRPSDRRLPHLCPTAQSSVHAESRRLVNR